MADGNRAGNLQLNANSTVTLGLVVAVLGATITAVYKASELITDMSYIKADIADMKRIIQRLDRQQRSSVDQERDRENDVQPSVSHIR